MPKTSQIELKFFRCLLYGRTGIGKTTMLGTAPKPFIIATEDGLTPLFGQDLEFKRVNSLAELRVLFSVLAKDKVYETICLDSLSALCDLVLAEVEKELGTDEAMRTYPVVRSKIWNVVTGFLKLPKHVIMTATETKSQDGTALPSMIGGKLCEDLARPFDFVQYMAFGAKDDEVVIHTGRHRDCLSKDRTGELGQSHKYCAGYFEDLISTVFGGVENKAPARNNPPNPETAPKKEEKKDENLDFQIDDGIPHDL